MSDRIQTIPPWGPTSTSWQLAAVAGASLVGLGIFGLARPAAASGAFGLPIRPHRDARVWRPKAGRDLATGVMTLALLALGNKRALGTYAAACAVIPASDAMLVALDGPRRPWQVVMHAATSGLTLALGASLLRDNG